MRAFKTVNDTYIEPISFTVPRRAETFQSDIFPPAIGTKPAVSAQEWISGKTGLPPKIDFESVYEGHEPVEVPADYKPPAPAPAPASKPVHKEPEPAPAPSPVAARAPPPDIKDQKSSIAALASKYDDKEEVDNDSSSSFEEVSKPHQRNSVPPKPKPAPAPVSPTKTTTAEAPRPGGAPFGEAPSSSRASNQSTGAATPTATSSAAANGSVAVEASLEEIKHLLENQTKMINAQNQYISQLTAEMDGLKKRVGSGSQDQSERIRQLELELESLRS